ncbi:hypothetical protein BDV28DRAFT_4813 [Aspergillus coremiiformis]|uniref:Rhodopsin domain-containing protein n=1 Tax=Aspergillus coremiiformis TaxID=138285 RepID=A0A5N6Z3N9_9EURO|nr:hypothetical protein BDV28DRAFT_4813 [Aspergillus coremiiformis]
MSMDSDVPIALAGVFGALSVALMLLRLTMRTRQGQSLLLSDYLTIVCIGLIMARTAFITVILAWGNSDLEESVTAMSSTEIYRRRIGSKLTLVNRVVYNIYLWLQKSVVLLLCQRILCGLRWPERIIKVCWAFLVASFVAVQVTTFTDCSPLRLYWQVMPPPGPCIDGHAQLLTLIAMNITTDTMLMLLPMPWLLRLKTSRTRRCQLVGLFSIGLLLIAVAIIRLPYFIDNTDQVYRHTWGSVEAFLSALAANIPTLFTLRQRRKKDYPPYYSSSPGGHEGRRGVTRSPTSGEGILVTSIVQLEFMGFNAQKSPISNGFVRQDSDAWVVCDK